MKRSLLVAILLVLGGVSASAADWNLVFEDEFDREELGDAWSVGENAKIVDGNLHHGLNEPGVALINRTFAPDVKVAMTAEALPGRPPCDLSIALACPTEPEVTWGYLAAFGGGGNMWHHIIGGGQMTPARIKYPPNLIEPGRIYDITATKDGKQITLEVDGEIILTATDEDPLGGPGFNHAGLLTWNGMIVYDVQVYERATPNPETPKFLEPLEPLPLALNEAGQLHLVRKIKPSPELQQGITLYNNGDLEEAEQAFLKVEDPLLRALGVVYAVGHVEYIEDRADNQRAGQMLLEVAEAEGKDNLALYGDFITRIGLYNRGQSGKAVKKIVSLGPDNNPYYDKARFYMFRFQRAAGMEGARRDVMAQAADGFRELLERYPTNQSLRELAGESIPWGEEFTIEDEGIPLWARATREAYARQVAVLHEWFENRQAPDGQLGGGWGDDVELLRSWGPIAFISDGDPEIRDGIERLAEGMWREDLVEYGFAGDIGDVEHAAEPSADTVPTMLVLRYGDPLWLERNMKSCRSIRDYYMDYNEAGQLQFISSYYGGDKAGQHISAGGDSMYNVRTMKHIWWQTWYGNKEAERIYLEWADTWLDKTMMELPDKPAGVVPGHIWYPTGDLISPERPDSTWYEDVGQYMPGGPGASEMQQSIFLSAYTVTGDSKYLQPMGFLTRWMAYGPLIDRGPNPNPEVGSWDWVIRNLQYGSARDALPYYWWVSGDSTVEEYVLRFASPMQRYLVGHDLDALINRLHGTARGLRTNFLILTKEMLQTDRAAMPGDMETYGAYTGGFLNWRNNHPLTSSISWEVPHTNFGALVHTGTENYVRVWVYNFEDEPTRMGIKHWRLQPGQYEVLYGPILEGEVQGNLRYGWHDPEDFVYERRGDTFFVDVPPGEAWAIDFRLLEPMEVDPIVPDLALHERDVRFSMDQTDVPWRATVTVHNVGLETAEDIVVAVQKKSGNQWEEIARRTIPRLESPDDLVPRTADVEFGGTETVKMISPGDFRIVIDPDDEIDELYEGNNIALFGHSEKLDPGDMEIGTAH